MCILHNLNPSLSPQIFPLIISGHVSIEGSTEAEYSAQYYVLLRNISYAGGGRYGSVGLGVIVRSVVVSTRGLWIELVSYQSDW